MPPIKLIIIGAGSRGANYAEYAISHPDQAQVVGVADPREHYRTQLAARHGIPSGNVFADWRQVAERPRFADAVIIATPDALHAEPAIAFAEPGLPHPAGEAHGADRGRCRQIAAAAQANGVMFAVCHVLRYTAYTKTAEGDRDLRPAGRGRQRPAPGAGRLLAPGALLRPRQLAQRARVLLHAAGQVVPRPGLDPPHHGPRCTQVSSFGSLLHFRPENRPAGAADRCLDCAVEAPAPTRRRAST